MMERIPDVGHEIYDLAEKIYPICRSITGAGVRETLNILSDYIGNLDEVSFHIYEVPSGTQAFDWTVPREWVIREAYIEDRNRNKIIDMKNHNLHVVGYSAPVDKWVALNELKECVYVQEDQPSVIPYVTSYYKERYGFCMSKDQLDSLEEGDYHIYIDSEYIDGSLTYAEVVLPGDTEKELLLTSYICHPSMANNECSGVAMTAALIRYVHAMKKRRYTYRFVLNPETIGAIVYISRNLEHLKKNLTAGIVLSCVGDDRHYSMIESRYGNTLADKSLKSILTFTDQYTIYPFLERGSDERQYNAPGIDLPVAGFCRTKYGRYPEYHTSADNMDLISPLGLQRSFNFLVKWINSMEYNYKYKVTVLGEPQLGKRGLYTTISKKGSYDQVMAVENLIAYADGKNDLFDISRIIGIEPYDLIPIIKKLLDHNLIAK